MTADRPRANVTALTGVTGTPTPQAERLLSDEQLAERVSHHLLDAVDPLSSRLSRIAWLLGTEGYVYDPEEAAKLRANQPGYRGQEDW